MRRHQRDARRCHSSDPLGDAHSGSSLITSQKARGAGSSIDTSGTAELGLNSRLHVVLTAGGGATKPSLMKREK